MYLDITCVIDPKTNTRETEPEGFSPTAHGPSVSRDRTLSGVRVARRVDRAETRAQHFPSGPRWMNLCICVDALPAFILLLVASVTCMLVTRYRAAGATGWYSTSTRPNTSLSALPFRSSPPSSTSLGSSSSGSSKSHLPPRTGFLAGRPYSTAMFKQAVKNHTNPAPTASQTAKATPQQQSILNTFRHQGSTQTPSARPLSTASGNTIKSGAASERRTSATPFGTKRTASGLAKALGSQEDFDYPNLSLLGASNPVSNSPIRPIGNMGPASRAPPAPVFFDENDFDSDIDLDVEDPSTKGTISYPKLPAVEHDNRPKDSGYASTFRTQKTAVPELDSSQPIPWSSSPIEHMKKPAAPPPQPTKRRTLPWLKNSQSTQSTSSASASASQKTSSAVEPESSGPALKKRKSGDATPVAKETGKTPYPWNTTASAVKEKKKTLREANQISRANRGTSEDVEAAIAKKKKNTLHRIFLSEEQQQVLNLVTEYKKSVFFTGSAGRCLHIWLNWRFANFE